MKISPKIMKLWIKPVIFIASLLPLAQLVYGFYYDELGANPVEKITFETGTWSLRFLLIGLSITPLRKLTATPSLIMLRRMIGLFAFFYACLHLATYLYLDQYFYWPDIYADIVKRPFITVGFIAFLGLVPLAMTSNRFMIRKLAGRWAKLHKLIYPISILAVLHFWWKRSAKLDFEDPAIYVAILFVLLAYRVVSWLSARRLLKSSEQISKSLL